MSNRFTISFESADTSSVLDGVSSDPANSNAEVAGTNVDTAKENKPTVNGDPATAAAEDGTVVAGAEIQEEVLEIAADAKANQDPAVGLDEIEQMAETIVAIESELNEISNELCENDRVIEVVDSLQDIQAITENTPEGQTVDMNMLQTAANMAVAGTDADADSIIPALETFKDKQLAVEAIGEKIKAASLSVLESVKNIGVKMANVLKNIFSTVGRFEEGLKAREKAVNAISANVSFQIKGSRYFQKDKNSYVANGAEYISSLTEAVKFYNSWSTMAVKSIADFDGSIGEWYRTLLSRKDSKDATRKLYDSYVKEFGQGVRSLPGVTEVAGDKQTHTFATPAMLGGVSMKASIPRNVVDYDTGSVFDVRASITQTKVVFDKDYYIHNKATPTIDFTLAPKDLKAIIAMDKQLLSDLKKYLNESYKRFKRWSDYNLGSPESPIAPNSTLLVAKGMNNAAWNVSYSRAYGEGLLRSTFIVLDKAIQAASKPAAAPAAAVA